MASNVVYSVGRNKAVVYWKEESGGGDVDCYKNSFEPDEYPKSLADFFLDEPWFEEYEYLYALFAVDRKSESMPEPLYFGVRKGSGWVRDAEDGDNLLTNLTDFFKDPANATRSLTIYYGVIVETKANPFPSLCEEVREALARQFGAKWNLAKEVTTAWDIKSIGNDELCSLK